MALVAKWKGQSLKLDRGGLFAALVLGHHPVQRQLQQRLSGRAVHHLGRGGDGVRAAADPQQPARLGLPRPEAQPPLPVGRAGRGLPASACCSSTSCAAARSAISDIAIGLGLTTARPDRRVGRQRLSGRQGSAAPSAAGAARLVDGDRRGDRHCSGLRGRRPAGRRGAARLLGRRDLPRAVRLGAVLRALFPGGAQDRPGQGGLFERDGADHRHEPVDPVRRLSLEPAGDRRGGAGARRNAPRARRTAAADACDRARTPPKSAGCPTSSINPKPRPRRNMSPSIARIIARPTGWCPRSRWTSSSIPSGRGSARRSRSRATAIMTGRCGWPATD